MPTDGEKSREEISASENRLQALISKKMQKLFTLRVSNLTIKPLKTQRKNQKSLK